MNICRNMLCFVAVVVAVLANPLRTALAADSCHLAAPPVNAAVIENHAQFLFVFPRTITAEFTGCQTIWDEKGAEMWSTKFDHGSAVKQEFKEWPGEPALSCSYVAGKLTSGNQARCPKEAGPILTFSVLKEPTVPPERDPRRQTP